MQIEEPTTGANLPEREYVPDAVQLFMYNAALWNAHRIHFDRQYATEIEGYRDLVVPGPLMGDWLTQCVVEWIGDRGRLVSVEYSNRRAAYRGDRLRVGGSVVRVDTGSRRVDVDLWVRDSAGEIVTPGSAVVQLI